MNELWQEGNDTREERVSYLEPLILNLVKLLSWLCTYLGWNAGLKCLWVRKVRSLGMLVQCSCVKESKRMGTCGMIRRVEWDRRSNGMCMSKAEHAWWRKSGRLIWNTVWAAGDRQTALHQDVSSIEGCLNIKMSNFRIPFLHNWGIMQVRDN